MTPKNIHNWKVAFLSNAELAMALSKSVSQYKEDNAKLKSQIEEYAKKVGQLTLERDFLEGKLKSLELSDRKLMIDSEHKLSIAKQSLLLDVPRSSLYYQPITKEYKEKIKSRLVEIHQEIPCYGYIKAQKQLNEEGYSICENTVMKYRKELGIKAILAVREPNKEHAIIIS